MLDRSFAEAYIAETLIPEAQGYSKVLEFFEPLRDEVYDDLIDIPIITKGDGIIECFNYGTIGKPVFKFVKRGYALHVQQLVNPNRSLYSFRLMNSKFYQAK